MEKKKYIRHTTRKSPSPGAPDALAPSWGEQLKAILISIAIAAAASLVVLLAGAGAAHSSSDPAALEIPLSFAALFIGIAVGALAASRLSGGNRFLSVLIFSAVVIAIIFTVRLSLGGAGAESVAGSSFCYLGALLSSLFGWLLSGISIKAPRPSAKKKIAKLQKRKR